MAFCPRCGRPYTPNEDKFCAVCGTNLDNLVEVATIEQAQSATGTPIAQIQATAQQTSAQQPQVIILKQATPAPAQHTESDYSVGSRFAKAFFFVLVFVAFACPFLKASFLGFNIFSLNGYEFTELTNNITNLANGSFGNILNNISPNQLDGLKFYNGILIGILACAGLGFIFSFISKGFSSFLAIAGLIATGVFLFVTYNAMKEVGIPIELGYGGYFAGGAFLVASFTG